jgi:uncharacterized tellurite resistance protein B-like protein
MNTRSITETAILLFFLFSFHIHCKQEKTVGAHEIQQAKARIESICLQHGVPIEELGLKEEKIYDLLSAGEQIDYEKIDAYIQKTKRALDEIEKSKEREQYFWTVVKPEISKTRTKEEYIQVAKKYPQYVQMPDE